MKRFVIAPILAAAFLLPVSSSAQTALSSAPTVKIQHTATMGKILTTPSGFTLYRFSPDKHNHSNCAGECAKVWPPYMPSSHKLSKPRGLPGKLGLIRRAGTSKEQLTYNGEPLYRYTFDKKAHQVHGEGVGKVWYVIHA